MASSILKVFLLLSAIFFSQTFAIKSNASTTSLNSSLSSITSFCKNTPFPDVCFNSLKLSISVNIGLNILNYLLHSLQVSISEATKLSDFFMNAGHSNIIENQKGAIQDCQELHQ
ncbi:Pectinesterase, partial [Quillaja saponaria]